MFIKREDLVDMLEVIDCENGYVDLDHLIECCNNLPSSGMSVWCMKCGNNGECMSIDKPNCFQPRQADRKTEPQTCEECEHWNDTEDGCADRHGCKTENSSEKPNNCEYAENPSGDVWECGCFLDTYCEHQIYDRNPDGTINIVECGYEPKTEPQTETEAY